MAVAEGPGHRHDTLLVLEESGLGDVLYEDRIPFHDVNMMEGITVPNLGRQTKLSTLTFPRIIKEVDWIVSMAKNENASLGRCHIIDEKLLRNDARYLLRVAQERASPRRHTSIHLGY